MERAGWHILARNWRGGGGELDIVVASADVTRVGLSAFLSSPDVREDHGPSETPRARKAPANEVRFVEVKLRDPDDPLSDEALTSSKRTRLRSCARAWLDAHPQVLGAELAFLVAVVPRGALDRSSDSTPRAVVWLDDAFDG